MEPTVEASPVAGYVAGAAAWRGIGGERELRLGAVGAPPAEARHVVLVEGWSDLAAVEALAAVAGFDLAAEGVGVCSVGGVTNVGHALRWLRAGGAPPGAGVTVLCDAGEVEVVRRAGTAYDLVVVVCDPDLEGELIAAAGPDAVVDLAEDLGESRALAAFRQMPSQHGVPLDRGLRRFIGTRSGRKVRYAAALVHHLGQGGLPPTLQDLLGRIRRTAPTGDA